MLRLAVVVASLGLATATRGSHVAELTQCVHKCEQKNECHASLDSYSCEVSCDALCKCAAISRRMLNKPKHCMASMLEKHQKTLSMLRMKKATIKKVVLQDDDAKPKPADNDFSSYVPLEDFWPQGKRGEAQKPRMLNSRKEMSLLRDQSMPWSAAHRGHHKHHRHHAAALLAKNASNASKPVEAKAAPPAPKVNASKPVVNASKPVEATVAPKVEPAKVAKPAAPVKPATSAKKSLVAAHVAKQPVDIKSLNKELKGLDGTYKNGHYTTPEDTNYKNDKAATGDWGNEYGPAPQEVNAAQQKKKTTPDTEHTDGETATADHGAEYKNPQTETQWKGKVGDTDYYREKASATACGVSAVALSVLYIF